MTVDVEQRKRTPLDYKLGNQTVETTDALEKNKVYLKQILGTALVVGTPSNELVNMQRHLREYTEQLRLDHIQARGDGSDQLKQDLLTTIAPGLT